MNKGMINWSIINRKVTLFLVFIMIALGLYAYYVIPKQESPDVTTTVAVVTAVYPGAAPEDVEKLVTSEIEDKVKQIKGFRYSESQSRNSVAAVVLYLESDTDADKAWTDLREKMQELDNQLPEGCWPIQVDTDLAETAGIILVLSNDSALQKETAYSNTELATFAKRIERELAKVRGISKVKVFGEQQREVRVVVDHQRLANYNSSMDEVVQVLVAQNVEIPSGTIDDGKTKINVVTPAMFASLNEIENLVIKISAETGAVVRLKDLADVNWGIEEDAYKNRFLGDEAVLVSAYFADDMNIVLVGNEVEQELERLRYLIPEGVKVDQVLFQPGEIQQAVSGFITDLLKGVLLVILVVLFGSNLRNSLIVSTAIPLSILMTFIAMYLFKIKVD